MAGFMPQRRYTGDASTATFRSADRVDRTEPTSNCTVGLRSLNQYGRRFEETAGDMKAAVRDLSIRRTVPNVNEHTRIVPFREGASSTVLFATIDIGEYAPGSMGAELGLAMTTAGSQTYTCTYNSSTSTFTITASSAFTLAWSAGTGVLDGVLPGMWGWPWGVDTGSATTHTSPQPAQVQPLEGIYLVVSGYMGDLFSSPNLPSVQHFIPLGDTGFMNDVLWHNDQDVTFSVQNFLDRRRWQLMWSGADSPYLYQMSGNPTWVATFLIYPDLVDSRTDPSMLPQVMESDERDKRRKRARPNA